MNVNDTWLYMTDCRGMALHKLHRVKFESTWMDQLKKSTVRTPPWLDVWVSEFGIHRDQPQLLKWLPWWHLSTRTPINQPQRLFVFLSAKNMMQKTNPHHTHPIPNKNKYHQTHNEFVNASPSPKKSPPHQLHRCIAFHRVTAVRLKFCLLNGFDCITSWAFPQKRWDFNLRKAIQIEHEVVNLTRSQLVYDLKKRSLNLSVPKFLDKYLQWRSKKSGSLTLLPLATCCILLSSCYRQKFSL